ncbi:MAG TPA: VWA domain-containing protein, partial [Parachlamydiaceae bacterium]|nr:VWA domain-containing protein [Parachlamydiaceae bacterium]
MEFNQLHFSNPMWLWGMLAIPVVWTAFILFFKPNQPTQQLHKFIDSHLLPFLLVKKQAGKSANWKTMLLWSIVWSCLVLALAGPRWNFREIEMLSKDQSLVILLDLSESMNANDIKPSRLVRAKQKIEDLINHSEGVNLGLIAFAADPHMITPITEDKETIRHLLPTLETELVYVQGSRLSPALEMASVMLDAEPGTNKAILV